MFYRYIFLALMFFLPACSTTDGTANQERQALLATIDTTYATVLVATATYEALPPCSDVSSRLCSNPGVVAEIKKAKAVMDVVVLKARSQIAAANDPKTMMGALQLALDAVAVFSKIAVTYGV